MPSDKVTIKIKAPFDATPRRRVSRRLHLPVVHLSGHRDRPGYVHVGPACRRVPLRVGNCTVEPDRVTCGHCRKTTQFDDARHWCMLRNYYCDRTWCKYKPSSCDFRRQMHNDGLHRTEPAAGSGTVRGLVGLPNGGDR
jgi:hypothetical protein